MIGPSRSCGWSKSLIKARRPSDHLLRCISAPIKSVLTFHCDAFCCISSVFGFFSSLEPGTPLSLDCNCFSCKLISVRRSADQQITSACFSPFSQTHRYLFVQIHTLTHIKYTHTHTHTFTRGQLDPMKVFLMRAEMTVEM